MEVLRNKDSPIAQKYRALYKLKEMEGDASIDALQEAIGVLDSVLLQHEICFALGQRGDEKSTGVLLQVLKDRAMNEVTRHEAGEALGAIGNPAAIPDLAAVRDDPTEPQAVRETRELAAARLEQLQPLKRFPRTHVG
ncbi:Deoxyhypusine hydroxylase [Diplonema papillatum]|nr:Deoxyhypusine hydroxylase [Diplonema papillatum]KAJ9444386.1 Deoxyhypusine hydroxylase [Diplonema papillatum]